MPTTPRVTVVTPTYNRPDYLAEAIRSVVGQRFTDWEMLVINDGGQDVRQIVDSAGREGGRDERIRYIHRPENTGKAACLNCALREARGQYIAYLDDDDLWYPNHLATLIAAIDATPGTQVAYSDLYEVVFIQGENGRRYPLQKRINVSRDYNRLFMFCFNQVLHVSLIHDRELALRAGGYDESIRVLIDWDITRKLSFYADFLHVPAITGEYYMSAKNSDRISDVQRKDEESYQQNLRRVRADVPPEPWPKVRKVVAVMAVARWDEKTRRVAHYFADGLGYPCALTLVNRDPNLSPEDCRATLGPVGDLRTVQVVQSAANVTDEEAVLDAARKIEADFYYFPTDRLSLEADLRMAQGVCCIEAKKIDALRWEIDPAGAKLQDVMLRKSALVSANPLEVAAKASVTPETWLPEDLKTDYLLHFADTFVKEGDYASADRFLQQADAIESGGLSSAYLVQVHANVAFGLGNYDRAEKMCKQLILEGYAADNWIRLGQIRHRRGLYRQAAQSYRYGLDAIGLREQDIASNTFPLVSPADYDAFTAMVGLGECYAELGLGNEAAAALRRASRLRRNSHRPYLAFGRLFLKQGDLVQAEEAFSLARHCDPEGKVAEIYAGLAQLREKSGKSEDAWQCWLQALAAAPGDPSARELPFYLAQVVRLGRRLGLTKDLTDILDRYLMYRPGDVAALIDLGRLHLEAGRTKEAAECAERAVLLNPDNKEASRLAELAAGTYERR